MGGARGTKRKIPMEKIAKKDSRSVAFSKRRNGLYSKTSELCVLSGAQVAILATPVSSKSNVSFYSFGHSSVDSVVSSFLSNQRPKDDLGLGFWWEDDGLANSEDSKELSEALDSISRMLQKLKGLHSVAVEKKKGKDVVIHETHQEVLGRDQTLDLQACYASICNIHDDPLVNLEGFGKNSGDEDQIINNNNNGGNLDVWDQELDLDQIIDFEMNVECPTMNLEMDGFEAGEDGTMVIYSNSDEVDNLHSSALDEDQTVEIADNNNGSVTGNLDGCNQDQTIDVKTNAEGLMLSSEMADVSTNLNSYSGSVADEDRSMVVHSNSNEDQMVATSDNNKNNINSLSGDWYSSCNQEMDFDMIFDFMMSSEGSIHEL